MCCNAEQYSNALHPIEVIEEGNDKYFKDRQLEKVFIMKKNVFQLFKYFLTILYFDEKEKKKNQE